MPDPIAALVADMSRLLWQAHVAELSNEDIARAYHRIADRHLKEATAEQRPALQAEIDYWARQLAPLYQPAFVRQAI